MVLAGAGPAYAAALVTGLRKPKGQRHGLSDVGDRGRSPQADRYLTETEQSSMQGGDQPDRRRMAFLGSQALLVAWQRPFGGQGDSPSVYSTSSPCGGAAAFSAGLGRG